MEKFGSFCDWERGRNLSKLKGEECCYPYHMISNCIYLQKTRTNNNCQVQHPVQSEFMIYLSSVDKLIIKNRKKIKKKQLVMSSSKNIYLTRQQKKIIENYNNDKNFFEEEKETKYTSILINDKFSNNKTVLPIKNKPNDDVECHKRKIKWSEYFTERRKSRRLNNQSPMNIEIEFEEDILNSSHDLKLLGLIPNTCKLKTKKKVKHETIENTDLEFSPDEKYSCQVSYKQNHKNSPVDDKLLDEYQNKMYVNFEKNTSNSQVSILNKDIYLENNFPLTLSYNSTENSVALENISNPVFDETFDYSDDFTFLQNKFSHSNYNIDSSIKTEDSHTHENSMIIDGKVPEQTYTPQCSHSYDFTNTNHTNPLSEFPQINKCNIAVNAIISENFSTVETIKLKQIDIYDNTSMYDKELDCFQTLLPTSCSYGPSEKQLILSTFNEEEKLIPPNKMKEVPSVIHEASLQKICFEEAETKNAPYQIKICSKIETKEVLSQNKTCFKTIETKRLSSPFEDCLEVNKSEKNSTLLENSYKIDKQLSAYKTFSKINDTKEFFPPGETFSEVIVREKMSILPKPFFEITETKKELSPNKSDLQITEIKDDLFLKETQSNIIKIEKKTCLEETFSDIDFANKVLSSSKLPSEPEMKSALFLEEQHYECTESKETPSIKEIFSEFNIKKEESSPCKPCLRIVETEETSNLVETFSDETNKLQSPCKPYPKITETENVLLLEEMHSDITVIEKTPCLLNTFSKIPDSEKASCPLKTYLNEANTEDMLYQSDFFSNKVVLRRPSILRTYSKKTFNEPLVLNKYSTETLKDKSQSKIHSEIIEKDGTLTLNSKSSTDISPKNKPSIIFPEINLIDKSSCPTIPSEETIKYYQVSSKKCPEIIKINKPVEGKKHLKITDEEKEPLHDKLSFTKSLELFCSEQSEKEDVNSLKSKNKFSCSKMFNEDYAEKILPCNPPTNTDKLKRSSVLESNQTNSQNHVAIPVSTSKKSSESSIHPFRKCFDKCQYCNRKFELIDTIVHISQIKHQEELHECLKIVPHIIGPDSCLCTTCFYYIQKHSGFKNLEKNISICMILSCENTVDRIYHVPSLNKMKNHLNLKGIVFKDWINKNQKVHICDDHHKQLLKALQCHLCGNRTIHKFEVYKSEVEDFQLILDNDEVPVTVDCDSFICKSCRVYLLWKSCENTDKFDDQLRDYVYHRNTVLRRIFEFNKFKYPSFLKKNDEKMMEKKTKRQFQKNLKHSLSISSLPLTENYNNSNHTITLPVNQKQMACNSDEDDEVVQKLKTYDINKLTIPDSKSVDISKLAFTKSSTTTVSLETNQKTPDQLDMNTSNNVLFQTPFTEPKSVQTKQKNEDGILSDLNDKMLRLMCHKFLPNAQNLINHLIFIEKTISNGGLQLVDDTVKYHCITHSDDHTTLLPQKSSVPSHFIQHNLKPESNKYNYNVDDDNEKLKTAKKSKLIDCPKTMKNGLQYNEPPHILTTITIPKIISPSLSSVSKNDVHKALKDHSNKLIYSSSDKQVFVLSTVATNTSVNTSTVIPKIISVTTSSKSINPIAVKKPAITITSNSCFRATSTVSSTTTATTAIPVSQKFIKIACEKSVSIKPMNLFNNNKMIFMNKNGIINANFSQNKPKFVKVLPKMCPSLPLNKVSQTTGFNMQRTLKYIDPEKLINKKL